MAFSDLISKPSTDHPSAQGWRHEYNRVALAGFVSTGVRAMRRSRPRRRSAQIQARCRHRWREPSPPGRCRTRESCRKSPFFDNARPPRTAPATTGRTDSIRDVCGRRHAAPRRRDVQWGRRIGRIKTASVGGCALDGAARARWGHSRARWGAHARRHAWRGRRGSRIDCDLLHRPFLQVERTRDLRLARWLNDDRVFAGVESEGLRERRRVEDLTVEGDPGSRWERPPA